MRPTFLGLETALRALMTQRKAMDVTGHNIANAATPGYVRQEAELVATRPYTPPGIVRLVRPGQIGTGVEAARVRRIFDGFVERRIWLTNTALGKQEELAAGLEQVEMVFNDPGDNGIQDALSRFWGAWDELSKRPESLPARAVVVEEGKAVADFFNRAMDQFERILNETDFAIEQKVNDINSLAKEIANLNAEISKIKVTGNEPNDLMDQRDRAVNRLSKIVGITVIEPGDGTLTVQIGEKALVRRNLTNAVEVKDGAQHAADIVWAESGEKVIFKDGELGGFLDVRDKVVPEYRDRLRTLRERIVDDVNLIHQGGYDLNGDAGGEFFVMSGGQLAVNSSILANPGKIAAADSQDATGGALPGDGGNAAEIAALEENGMVGSKTYNAFYGETIALLGTAGNEARRMTDVEKMALSQHTAKRESISGVSVEEEMINLVRYQGAYDAAARLVTALDEMLDTLINRTGVVGR